MDPQTPQQGASGPESSRTTGALTKAPPTDTPQQLRHQWVHRDAANAATSIIPLDAHINILPTTRSSKNMKQHAIGCDWIHIRVDSHWLPIYCTAGVHRELRDQCIAACNGKPPCSTNAFVNTVLEIEHHDMVSCGILVDKFHDKRPPEWTNQALMTLEEATEAYMVEVIPNLIFRSCDWFLLGFQQVCYNGKARRSGTATTVRHAPCVEYGSTGQKRVFACHNWRNSIPHQETMHRSPRSEDVECCVSRAWKGESCDWKTPGYGSWESHRPLPSLPKWHRKEYADTLEAQKHGCTSSQTDSIFARNTPCTTHATSCWWGSWTIPKPWCATRMCVCTYSSSQRSVFQLWCIYQGSQAWSRF